MTNNLHISVSPHISSPRTTSKIMLDVLIALLPTAIAGIIIFGIRALAVIAAGVISAVLAEYLFCLITKKEQTIGDMSAAVTGLILALNLPANTPIWQIVVGAAFAIIFIKCIFGGIGKNFANPAITARIFMLVAFSNLATNAFPKNMADTASSATPLAQLLIGKEVDLLDLFLGNKGGAIGEVCILAILIGFAYLLVRRVIKWQTPVVLVLTVFLLSLFVESFDFVAALSWILSGGLMFGAVFMATDYVTTPTTTYGKIVFAVGVGFITFVIRFWGSYPEGVSFAILLMNILTPYIDKFTSRKPFGGDIK